MDAKDVYKEVNANWRFLAKWRQIAFAGQFALVACALSFTKVAVDQSLSSFVVVPCFLLVDFLSVVLWIADKRTHELTMDACDAGVQLEGNEKGFFSTNRTSDERRCTIWGHSVAALLLCLGSVLVFTFLAIFVAFKPFSSASGEKEIWDYRVLHGPVVTSPSLTAPSLQEQLSQAGRERWELVANGTDATSGPFLILRRIKK